ncbi:hypothetical protein WMY93_023039 [Mugilogobius chulae]|uniref:GOLD domain-containing protein n=1 Tax=Mugilogobius chulae TaxID=88201 RepID=A0AAW0N696_9GOBI
MMFLQTSSLFLVCALWPLMSCGPQSRLHENITDQDMFWGADQYDFSVVLTASALECFWHFAHYGEIFYLNFMVQWVTGVGHDRHLTVTVNAPGGLLLYTIDDATGQIRFEAQETGFYQMCFSNFHNRFGMMQVFLSFGVHYDGYEDVTKQKDAEKKKKEEAGKELNNTLSSLRTQHTKWRLMFSTCFATTRTAA